MSNEGDPNAQTLATPLPGSSGGSASQWVPYADSPYLLGPRIAAGGMGSVHLGLKQGALGFRRLLAIKRLHGHLAQDPEFVARFKDEIRLVSRLNHPNIVQTFDVLETSNELALVMEYVEGVTLYQLVKDASATGQRLSVEVVVGIVAQTLHGLHSAHELCDDNGQPLHLVHRDVSPQNVMVARDGLAKILDFGVAKAASETHVTRTGQLSGKAAYMSPEQATGHSVDRRTDVFAAGVVLWEALTGQRLFRPPGIPEAAALKNVLEMRVKSPAEFREDVSPSLERVVLRALERDPTRRYGSARDFALALEEAVPFASLSAVASGLAEVSGPRLATLGRALPPQTHQAESGGALPGGDWDRPPARFVPSVGPAELTRPLEGISVEGEQPSRTSRHVGLSVISVLALLAVAAVAVGTGLVGTGERTGAAGMASPPDTPAPKDTGASKPLSKPLQAAQTPPRGTSGFLQRGDSASTSPASTPERVVDEAVERVDARMNKDISQGAASTKSTKQEVDLSPPRGENGEQHRSTKTVTARNGTASKASSTNKPSTKKSTVRTANPTPQPPSRQCSPPTYTDAEGIRHFKPECL